MISRLCTSGAELDEVGVGRRSGCETVDDEKILEEIGLVLPEVDVSYKVGPPHCCLEN